MAVARIATALCSPCKFYEGVCASLHGSGTGRVVAPHFIGYVFDRSLDDCTCLGGQQGVNAHHAVIAGEHRCPATLMLAPGVIGSV